ncbi:MerR family DNA-binding protein [Massilia glaciei]|uniref:HTH merR-type domain-containing protein n=1 Tax=Massilia glaciei TaxID=1524097 RepID=A0A2U2HC65_9BURK|nr:MerR family DNA-binding protein [Massilia glaciei]PWF40525.1 hypothetical protein C7C56_025755 [Massilia glaciei]
MNHHTHAPHDSALKPRPAGRGEGQGLGIEDVTAYAGVSERLVRHCEARGLIPGAGEGDACRRRYTHEDVHVLRFARRAHVLGFGMKEVARMLFLWQNMRRMSPEMKGIVLSQRKELESRNEELQAMAHLLERLANAFAVVHQPACPILEELLALRAGNAVSEKP